MTARSTLRFTRRKKIGRRAQTYWATIVGTKSVAIGGEGYDNFRDAEIEALHVLTGKHCDAAIGHVLGHAPLTAELAVLRLNLLAASDDLLAALGGAS